MFNKIQSSGTIRNVTDSGENSPMISAAAGSVEASHWLSSSYVKTFLTVFLPLVQTCEISFRDFAKLLS